MPADNLLDNPPLAQVSLKNQPQKDFLETDPKLMLLALNIEHPALIKTFIDETIETNKTLMDTFGKETLIAAGLSFYLETKSAITGVDLQPGEVDTNIHQFIESDPQANDMFNKLVAQHGSENVSSVNFAAWMMSRDRSNPQDRLIQPPSHLINPSQEQKEAVQKMVKWPEVRSDRFVATFEKNLEFSLDTDQK